MPRLPLVVLASCLALFFVAPSTSADVTGTLAFLDSLGTPIEIHYPAGSDSAYMEVVDADLDTSALHLETAEVWVVSEYGDSEQVTLTETDLSTGVFRGAIAFDVQAFRLLEALQDSLPTGTDSASRLLRHEMIDSAWASHSSGDFDTLLPLVPGDGLFQVAPGDSIQATYEDLANNFGVPEQIHARTVYGGIVGDVSGTWTSSGNPYLVVGDIRVPRGDSLRIESGVEAYFWENASLRIEYSGWLRIEGTEADSVRMVLREGCARPWGGIYASGAHASLSYLSLGQADEGLVLGSSYSDSVQVSRCHIWGCSDEGIRFTSSRCRLENSRIRGNATGVSWSSWMSVEISQCEFTENVTGARVLKGQGLIRQCEFTGNTGTGLFLEYYSSGVPITETVSVEGTSVRDNGTGVTVSAEPLYDGPMPLFRGCEFYGNEDYDFRISGPHDVDARGSWWGEATTAEMNAGGNPKNIATIFDKWDYGSFGYVNYGGWVGGSGGMSGALTFLDSLGAPVDPNYPPGSDSAYLELDDPNLDTSATGLDVASAWVVSEYGDSEQVTLTETGLSTGVFRGAIPFDLQVDRFLEDLADSLPQGNDSASARIRSEMIMRALRDSATEDTEEHWRTTVGDGLLQVAPDDSVLGIYYDALNDWGEPDTFEVLTYYGGISGEVWGTWTAAGNPYLVVGDIYVPYNRTLRIEAGVEIQFWENTSLEIEGDVEVAGAEGNSVRMDLREGATGYWGGINVDYPRASLSAAYLDLQHGTNGVYAYHADTIRVHHSRIRACQHHALRTYLLPMELRLSNCRFENCPDGYGLYMYRSHFEIADCVMTGNAIGAFIDYGWGTISGCTFNSNTGTGLTVRTDIRPTTNDTLRVEQSYVVDNSVYGVYSIDGSSQVNRMPVYRECEFHGNGTYDFYTSGADSVDARGNWWGEVTTAEMNAGGNPKDIAAIYDAYDDSTRGFVNYGGWVGGPGWTGSLAFLDSSGVPLGAFYPAGADSAFVQLKDPDLDTSATLRDTASVWILTESGDFEGISLIESDPSSGVFQGSIGFDVLAFRFLGDLRDSLPVGSDTASIRLRQEMIDRALTELEESGFQRDDLSSPYDGLLQVAPGDSVRAMYWDDANDWGETEDIERSVYYGGMSGDVVGTWTAEESPYLVMGDIRIPEGDTLRLGPGTEVRFWEDVSLLVYGVLEAAGAEGDSVRMDLRDVEQGFWGGIRSYGEYESPSSVILDYVCLGRASTGISQGYERQTTRVSNTRIWGCRYDGVHSRLYYDCRLYLTQSRLEANGDGLSIDGDYGSYSEGSIRQCEIRANTYDGLAIFGPRPGGQLLIEQTSVIENGGRGVLLMWGKAEVPRASLPVFHSCQFFGNAESDFENSTSYDVDARQNYWGSGTTAEMNAGGNPKNITKIHDGFDESYYGFVDYSGWLQAPVNVVTWDGGGDGVSWGDSLNWDVDRLPGEGDDTRIPSGGYHVNANVDTTLWRLTLEAGTTASSLFVQDTLGVTRGFRNSGYIQIPPDAAIHFVEYDSLTNDSNGVIVFEGGDLSGSGRFVNWGDVLKKNPPAISTMSSVSLAFLNQSDDPGDGFLRVGGGILRFSDGFVNAGSVYVDPEAHLWLDPGDGFLRTGGFLQIADEGEIEITGPGTQLQNRFGGLMRLEGGLIHGTGTLVNYGTIQKVDPPGSSTACRISCLLLNMSDDPGDGFLRVGDGILKVSADFLNEGDVTVESGAALELGMCEELDRGGPEPEEEPAATITNAVGAVWNVEGTTNLDSWGAFVNHGAVFLGGNGTWINEGEFDHRENAVLAGTGIFDNVGGGFAGSGILRPGDARGTLSFLGSFDQTTTGEIEVDIGGTTPGIDHDRLAIIGSATLDGAVYVNLVDGFEPQVGDSFAVITIEGEGGGRAGFTCYSNLQVPEGVFLDPVRETGVFAFVARDSVSGNSPPIAADDFDSTNALTPITLSVLSNDSDPNGEPLRIVSVHAGGISGYVSIDPGDSTLSYAPEISFDGRDTLRYIVTDCAGGSDSAIVTVSVARAPRVWLVPGDAATVQAAIDSAWPMDTVEVAQGTRSEHGIVMAAGVVLRGETGNPKDVIIDADTLGQLLTCTGLDSTAAIIGLTLTCGIADQGGNLFCDSSDVRIENCRFSGGNATVQGGGVHVQYGSPTFTNCLFHHNQAPSGGAVSLLGSNASFVSCTIADNTVTTQGAGLHMQDSSPIIETTIIAENLGGEAISCVGSSPTLSCTDIYGNAGGDWTGCIAGLEAINNNLHSDPIFCRMGAPTDPLTLESVSPCAEENSPVCGPIGALPVGCAITEVEVVEEEIPTTYHLYANRPNPFNPTTTIRFSLPEPGRARLAIYAISGRRVALLTDQHLQAGTFEIQWDGTDDHGRAVSSGIYFARLVAGDFTDVRKMVLLK